MKTLSKDEFMMMYMREQESLKKRKKELERKINKDADDYIASKGVKLKKRVGVY